jgi:hypothetical protein
MLKILSIKVYCPQTAGKIPFEVVADVSISVHLQ